MYFIFQTKMMRKGKGLVTPLSRDRQERIPLVGVGASNGGPASASFFLRTGSCVSDPKVNNI